MVKGIMIASDFATGTLPKRTEIVMTCATMNETSGCKDAGIFADLPAVP